MSPADRFRRCTLAPVLVERLRAGTTLTATAPGADAREVEEAAADMLEDVLAVTEEEWPRLVAEAESVAGKVREAPVATAGYLSEPDSSVPCPVDKCPAEWGHAPPCPAPVAGVSAEERARWEEMARSPDPWTRYRVAPVLLAALEAAERDRDAALADRDRCFDDAEKAIGQAVKFLADRDAAVEREARAERERDAALARVGALSEAEANARRAADLAETLRRDLVAAEARAALAERERREARAETEKTREIWAGMLVRECPFCSGGSDV